MLKKLFMLAVIGLVGCTVLACQDLFMVDPGDIPDPSNINPADFVNIIDNAYFPLRPGTMYIYEGMTNDGLEYIEVYVTPQTRQVMGVTTTVVRDTVTVDGELFEETYDWFAQDAAGNVWYFGEDSKEYEDGEVVSIQGSWEAGVGGALPGIIMLAHPQVGDLYRQEYYAGVAEDMAEVLSLSDSITVPFGAFNHALKTREWNPLESDVGEYKYYVLGVGLVAEANISGGEQVRLIDIKY